MNHMMIDVWKRLRRNPGLFYDFLLVSRNWISIRFVSLV